MISGLDLTATTNYTLKNDKDNPTVWKLGVIPSFLFAKLSNESSGREIESAYKLLQLGLKGWENFDIKYETVKETLYGREVDVIPLSVLEKIPIRVITELSHKIVEVNNLSDDERKN